MLSCCTTLFRLLLGLQQWVSHPSLPSWYLVVQPWLGCFWSCGSGFPTLCSLLLPCPTMVGLLLVLRQRSPLMLSCCTTLFRLLLGLRQWVSHPSLTSWYLVVQPWLGCLWSCGSGFPTLYTLLLPCTTMVRLLVVLRQWLPYPLFPLITL